MKVYEVIHPEWSKRKCKLDKGNLVFLNNDNNWIKSVSCLINYLISDWIEIDSKKGLKSSKG